MKTLITNGLILDMVGEEPNIKKADILIENNKILKIEKDITDEYDKKINAKSMLIMPGLVNTHTHLQ